MFLKPLGKRVRFSIREQVDRTVPLQVDEQRAIATAFLEGKVIYPQNAGRLDWGKYRFFEGSEEGVGTEQQTERAGNTGGGFPADKVSQFAQGVGQPAGFAGIASSDSGERFCENAPWAVPVITKICGT